MTIDNPIRSKIYGPAQTPEEKIDVLLETITYDTIRNDPEYCKKRVKDINSLYEENKISIPQEVKKFLYDVEKALKG